MNRFRQMLPLGRQSRAVCGQRKERQEAGLVLVRVRGTETVTDNPAWELGLGEGTGEREKSEVTEQGWLAAGLGRECCRQRSPGGRSAGGERPGRPGVGRPRGAERPPASTLGEVGGVRRASEAGTSIPSASSPRPGLGRALAGAISWPHSSP